MAHHQLELGRAGVGGARITVEVHRRLQRPAAEFAFVPERWIEFVEARWIPRIERAASPQCHGEARAREPNRGLRDRSLAESEPAPHVARVGVAFRAAREQRLRCDRRARRARYGAGLGQESDRERGGETRDRPRVAACPHGVPLWRNRRTSRSAQVPASQERMLRETTFEGFQRYFDFYGMML